MSNVKGIERAELHKTIWRIGNDLRGGVNGWDFKSYVSVLHRGGAEFVRSGNKNKLIEETGAGFWTPSPPGKTSLFSRGWSRTLKSPGSSPGR